MACFECERVKALAEKLMAAIVAHHSVLVVEAFGSIEKDRTPIQVEVKESDPKQVSEILDDAFDHVVRRNESCVFPI